MTVQSSMNIAIFGLGSMGYGMAQSLLRAGHTVHGFDLVPQQVERFQNDGGAGGELADIAVGLDAVVVVVLNAGQTEDVLFGDNGVVPRFKTGLARAVRWHDPLTAGSNAAEGAVAQCKEFRIDDWVVRVRQRDEKSEWLGRLRGAVEDAAAAALAAEDDDEYDDYEEDVSEALLMLSLRVSLIDF